MQSERDRRHVGSTVVVMTTGQAIGRAMRKHDALTSQAITEATSRRSESKRGSGAHPGLSDTQIYIC